MEIGWGWQGDRAALDLCEVQVDHGDGKDSVLLTYDDNTPGYADPTPFPAVHTRWIYRAIHGVEDTLVEQSSNPVSVSVPA